MRIGYFFHGYLGDRKIDCDGNPLSTPDGNATYSWSIEHECNRRGYRLIPLGENLDRHGVHKHGEGLFAAFSQRKRVDSYARMLTRGWLKGSHREFPELDMVLVEWRWPIPGRNTPTDSGKPGYQRDLERMRAIINEYGARGTPIVIWDLDHKLTEAELFGLREDCVVYLIETSVFNRFFGGRRVEPPTVISDLLQHDIDDRRPQYHLGYVGSRYERDEQIDRWIGPIAEAGTHRVKFWGKWEPADEVRGRWPGVTFGSRIGVEGFYEAYSRVALVPLLAKESYRQSGFITPRPWEAILFGSMPVGLHGHVGIERYCPAVAVGPAELLELAREVRNMSSIRRRVLREEAAHRLSHMDVRHFVDVLEGLRVGTDAGPSDSVEEKLENVEG